MRKFLTVFSLLGLAVLLYAPQTLAFNTRLTIYSSVAQMRYIYVDDSGNIIKVGGNTASNIQPKVVGPHNKVIPMTDSINRQYQKLLDAHGGRLEASKIYDVNPVSVSLTSDTQIITVDTGKNNLTLTL